ncbi:hypothetical protein CEP51_016313 [Fusarium floridanum]|uniref:Uncharacterized protein n=1 Tax=Fusarium floridanum TaxID=1325733 RepID=A0A428NSX6_9HYPO|nr:hypothetical protein CEP51_016313 [Fusarium floridanum]
MQPPDYDRTHEHNPSTRSPISPHRATNTQSIYASLKIQIDELIDTFRERQPNGAPEPILPEQTVSHEAKIQQSLPYFKGRISTPVTGLEQRKPPPALAQVNKYFRRSLLASKKFGQEIGDSWTRRSNQRTVHSTSSAEDIVSRGDVDVNFRVAQELSGYLLVPPSQEHYPPLTVPSGPLFPDRSTTMLGLDLPNNNSLEAWHEGQPLVETLSGPEAAMKSYFDTSSDTELEASRHLIYKRRISKMKDHTFRWLRETFSLDEEEKAFFMARRSMRSELSVAEQRSTQFSYGRRVR